jgi:hypothetical protein
MSDPQIHDPSKPSNWCSIAPRPHLMTGFLREWFINHFAKSDNIEAKELRGKLWKAIPATDIVIESITQWRPDLTQKRLAIIIKRNDWQVQRIAIGDRLHGNIPFSGNREYSVLVTGSHTFFCLAGRGTEAEILAAEVYREMMQFGPVIRDELDLKRFVVVSVGSLFELEESKENFGVPVTVSYVADENWQLVPQSVVLKSIVLSKFIP